MLGRSGTYSALVEKISKFCIYSATEMSVIGFANGKSTCFQFNYNKLPIFNKFLGSFCRKWVLLSLMNKDTAKSMFWRIVLERLSLWIE
ncbi:hypothetical protein CK510_12685 [Brunnivagina elsteri CCALA 953]|uniref:Uncharacterized protein n=1 Tax=Brunnivagina elsteri CCALA 953 TaxID=987040 RepID=A0A2A2TJ71_9CYAN|nr:hypothetical protein CK510_12685 [Calothrix elsteri CCALA 953]